MDTIKDRTIPQYADPQNPLRRQFVVGAKQLRKALEKGLAREVYLAQNADPAITQPLAALCAQNRVPCTWVGSMQELGRACGIDVGAAAAAAVE